MAKAGMSTGVEVARISVKVSPDTKQFRRDLKSDLDAIEQSMKAQVDVDPDMTGFRQKVKAETQGLKANVEVDVDRSMLSRLREGIANTLDKINIPDPKFNGLNAAGAGLAGLVAVLAVAGPAVSLLTAGLLALPGLVAAVAAPVGALALGMDGLKAAAGRLQAPFDALKATMSKFTEAQFTPVFDKLAGIFPALASSLPKVTQGIADVAQSIVDTVTSAPGMAKIQDTIGNIASAISASAPGIASFVDGLLGLANVFSGKLAGLSDWLNQAGASFSEWVQKITADGTLGKAFDGLGSTLSTLASALGDIAKAGIEFFSDPSRIESFNSAVSGLGTALKSVVNDSAGFFDVVNQIKSVFTNFDFSGIIADLSAPFTSADAPWRTMWADLQSSATAAWSAVTGVVSSAVATISGIASSIGTSLTGIWAGISNAASSAWNTVVGVVQGAWSAIVGAVSNGVGQVVSSVSGMVSSVVGAIASLGAEGAKAGAALVQGLIDGIGGLISSAVAKARDLAGQVAGAVKGFLGINSPSKMFTEFGEYVGQGLVNGLNSQQSAVGDAAKQLAESLQNPFNDKVGIGFGKNGLSFSGEGDNPLSKAGAGLMNAPINLGRATTEQFLSDIGITGEGAISGLAKWALGPGIQYAFHVGNVDQAMDIKAREERKAALSYGSR